MINSLFDNFTILNHALITEIFLVIAVLALLVCGVRKGDQYTGKLSVTAIVILLLALILNAGLTPDSYNPWSEFITINNFILLSKFLIIASALVSLLLYLSHLRYNVINCRFEYPVIVLLAVIGMLVMVSANDFLTFYLALELQSLAIYILVALNIKSKKSSEAALKYFVLGALTSGILLFGVSLIYGFSGSINFTHLATTVTNSPVSTTNLGVILGLIFVLAALCFKISAVPFHMWTPDVYQGSPTPVTIFMATAPKVAAFTILFRILYDPLKIYFASLEQILAVIAVLSLFIGAAGAIRQENLKRLLAYGSINHVGFMLLAILAYNIQAVQALFIYLVIYLTLLFGAFAFLMLLKQSHHSADSADKKQLEDISSFAGLSKTYPALAVAFAILLFSMAGIPPFAGFFSKFYIFQAILLEGYYKIAVLAALSAVIAAFYYLKIVKIMFFDEGQEIFDKKPNFITRYIFLIAVLFNISFFVKPGIITDYIKQALSGVF